MELKQQLKKVSIEKQNKTILKDIVIKNKDGFTISLNLKPSKHNKGFYIAITDNSNKDINKAIKNLFKIYKKDFKQIEENKLFIGGWIDNNTKRYYIDLSIHQNSLKNAVLMGKLFKQKAIYDIKNNDSIYLK